MGCEQDTPYCDECHAKAMQYHEFEPCDECKEMLKHFCWVCMSYCENEIKDGCCEACNG